MIVGFLPWVAYWAMVGSVSFRLSVSIAFALSIALTVGSWLRGERPKVLEAGSAIVFALIMVLAFATDDRFLERWIQPLTNAGLFAVVAGSLAIGRPFTIEYAREQVSPDVAALPGFTYVNKVITAVWAGAFAVMTVSSLVPPAIEGEATLREGGSTLSVLGYWVVPFTALGLAGLFSARFPDRFTADDDAGEARADPERLALPEPGQAGGMSVSLEPRSRVDRTPALVVRGAEPGERVELELELEDAFGGAWRSRLRYRADETGAVDPSRAAPIDGPVESPDPGAPIWSAEALGASRGIYLPPASSPLTVVATAGRRATMARGERLLAGEGVRVEEIRDGSLVGRIHVPSGEGPHPGVALFGGSEGGIDNSLSPAAAALASHGCLALVVGLFGTPGLDEELIEIPLERYGEALRWLARHPATGGAPPAAVAISKGAEGLLASLALDRAPPVSAAVAISPSAVVWQAVGEQGPVPGRSSWTADGEPLPFAEMDTEAAMNEMLRNALLRGVDRRRHRPTLLHLASTYRFDRVAPDSEQRIAAERIEAPLLLLSGEADELWPSTPMASALAARREGASATTEQHSYSEAGHLLRMPLIPTTGPWAEGIAFGGTARGLAAAQADLGARIVEFLRRTRETGS
jgi:hypothetical protein